MKRKLTKDGRCAFTYSINPEVNNEFMGNCHKNGWIASRKLEIMMDKFNKKLKDVEQ